MSATKMSVEAAEEAVDAIGLGCSKETFTEYVEVEKLIEDSVAISVTSNLKDLRAIEVNWQRFSFILDQYQEQPHLIDPHLETILGKIIVIVRNEALTADTKHIAFRYLYFISKVRGYKVIARHLPHEISDLEPLLRYLESQNPADTNRWETHYGLLLWFSIVVKIPFHLKRFETSSSSNTVMERIFNVCKDYVKASTVAQNTASYLSALYLTRPDVKDTYLPLYFEWIKEVLLKENVNCKKGVLLTVAGIFKHGQREQMIMYATEVLHHILSIKFQPHELSIIKKPLVKLIQRLGLIFLKPRIASWRYQRGSRSLAANLISKTPVNLQLPVDSKAMEDEDDDDFDVPEEIEEVLEEILRALRDKNREVQYSAAKGIGRLTQRLSKDFADQVVESIVELFSLKESDMAWHGGCLALAELARRGLLLPQRLVQVLPLVEQAMLYDELRGNFSVGSAVRDAACYLCWALARSYDPLILEPYVKQLAKSLIITSVFDREVNCRRAAASAFQEHVGRQGTFPHGIDILTTCDYFAVGLRKNAYLHLSLFVAQYEEYRPSLIDHLVNRKIMHWDSSIRQLTAQTLHHLTLLDPVRMKDTLLVEILPNCTHTDLHLRHGSILASGQIINAICQAAAGQHIPIVQYFDSSTAVTKVCSDIVAERFWKSFGGDLMRTAACQFIDSLSLGRYPLDSSIINLWLNCLYECLASSDGAIQKLAVKAITSLVGEYLADGTKEAHLTILHRFLAETTGNNQQARMGNALAVGSMPTFVLLADIPAVVQQLRLCATISDKTVQWAEARKNALWALSQLASTVGVSSSNSDSLSNGYLDEIFQTFLVGVEDYTVDSRGDIGAIVRESAMSSLQIVLELANKSNVEFLQPELIRIILHTLIKQSTEQIRRTRLLAANIFSSLIYCDPPIPHIVQREELQSIIPEPPLEISTEKECFDLWIRVMDLDPYRKSVITGLVSSIGSLTESLVKSSSVPFFAHLRQLMAHDQVDRLKLVADDILDIFESNLNNARFMPYMFSFLDQVCSSGCLDVVFKSISQRLFTLIRTEMSSGSKPLKLLIASIDLYCHLLRGDEETFDKAISHLMNMLIGRFPRVRKITATKLYEALLTLTDISETLEASQDEILTILSDTNWDEDIESLKPIRNQLRQLFIPS